MIVMPGLDPGIHVCPHFKYSLARHRVDTHGASPRAEGLPAM